MWCNKLRTVQRIEWRNDGQLRVKYSFKSLSLAELPGLRFPKARVNWNPIWPYPQPCKERAQAGQGTLQHLTVGGVEPGPFFLGCGCIDKAAGWMSLCKFCIPSGTSQGVERITWSLNKQSDHRKLKCWGEVSNWSLVARGERSGVGLGMRL